MGAQSDDVIVISFAGHGSPDGNLVVFDTDPANLAGTAVSMADLAEAFKATKAGAVLCILDCCCSGQAPAARGISNCVDFGVLQGSAPPSSGNSRRGLAADPKMHGSVHQARRRA
jgi:hypothetical protein